jgi:PAS domain S-box-containing protein
MGRESRDHIALMLLGALSGLTLLDVFTGWSLLGVPVVAVGLAAGILAFVLGRSVVRRAISLLVLFALGLHLGYILTVDYEAGRWERLRVEKAESALAHALADLDGLVSRVENLAGTVSKDQALAASLRSESQAGAFSAFRRLHDSGLIDENRYGVVISGLWNPEFAWAGRFPNLPDTALVPVPGVRVVKSTTYYWVESVVPIEQISETVGWVKLYRHLDPIYPGVLGESAGLTLSERLTRNSGHQVSLALGGSADSVARNPGKDVAQAAFRLPDGTVAGRVEVRYRTLDDERRLLAARGLFFASVACLLLIIVGSGWMGRRLIGPRFARASALNLIAVLGLLGGARVGFALLREALGLGGIGAFTPYYYATQFPLGLLRSPADLVITCLFAVVGVTLVILAGVWRRHGPVGKTGTRRPGDLPHLVGALLSGIAASGLILAAGRIIARAFADSSADIFLQTPFDFTPSYVLVRVGLFLLTVAAILVAGKLIAFQITVLRRYGFGGTRGKSPLLVAGVIQYVMAGIFIAAGARWQISVIASLCLGFAVVLDLVRVRRIAFGLIAAGLGFALAASVVEFPYALIDHKAKRVEGIKAASEDLVARTDAWKISVLEEALDTVARNASVRQALESGARNLDDLALRIWATSILSESNLTSSVYLLDAAHEEIGRFSLQDVGEVSQLDAALREARYQGRPITLTTRGTSGGQEVDLYVGVAPFFRDERYLGSVVLSIPLAYTGMESVAGFRPTLFEALEAARTRSERTGADFSASLVAEGRIVSTTAPDIEVGKDLGALKQGQIHGPVWLEHEIGGLSRGSYFVPSGGGENGFLLSYPLPTFGEKVVSFMGLTAGNIIIGFLVILAGVLGRGLRHVARRLRGLPGARMRWSFASKLALAFVLIAIIPTLILGTASRRFLEARAREVMESKAEENLNLSRMALDRLVFAEAVRLARNPILMDALRSEPSLLGQMVTHELSGGGYDVSAAVLDSAGAALASFGNPDIPPAVLRGALDQGMTYNFFADGGELRAEAAVPVRDEIYPEEIVGCAFVARNMDDRFSRQIASELGIDLSLYSGSRLAASSKRELFVSELMSSTISPGAYVACFIDGRELHYSWERVGDMQVVVGYRPLRGPDGNPVGAMSVPVVPTESEAGRRIGLTSAAISYLIVIVICAIFIFGLLLARNIAHPIRQLIRGTMRIGSGDLGFTIPKPSDDEIGDLVTSFNRMTAALAKSSKALSERKRYIETIIGNVGAGIISTGPDGRIDTFNAAAETILKMKARNARGRDAKKILRRAGASGLADVLDDVRGPGEVARREVAFTGGDGTLATLRAVATVVGAPRRKPMGKVIVFEDVTELIKSKKLVAWSEMARQVAHEIKNPLTPMKLSAQHLLQARRDGVGDFDRVLEESVATIVEEIESLRRIAVEFSQFSRMPERNLEWTDINALVDDSLSQYERAIGISVKISKNLDPRLPKLKVDRDEVKRVFVNIVENAMQAMPEGGNLDIISGRSRPGRGGLPARKGGRYDVRVSSSEGPTRVGEFLDVIFSDTGTGIPTGNAGKLFEPNFSTKSHGTGLGLAICKGVMDAYGGEILIESKEGAGTRVSVRFPLRERRTHSRSPRGPRKKRGPLRRR